MYGVIFLQNWYLIWLSIYKSMISPQNNKLEKSGMLGRQPCDRRKDAKNKRSCGWRMFSILAIGNTFEELYNVYKKKIFLFVHFGKFQEVDYTFLHDLLIVTSARLQSCKFWRYMYLIWNNHVINWCWSMKSMNPRQETQQIYGRRLTKFPI